MTIKLKKFPQIKQFSPIFPGAEALKLCFIIWLKNFRFRRLLEPTTRFCL